MRLCASLLPGNPVIVEAGAFDGTDTKKLAAFWPKGRYMHLSRYQTFLHFVKNTEHLFNVIRHPWRYTIKLDPLFFMYPKNRPVLNNRFKQALCCGQQNGWSGRQSNIKKQLPLRLLLWTSGLKSTCCADRFFVA